MAISQTRYILITSAVGGRAVAGRRELIARGLTTNVLAPTKGILEFAGGGAAALKNVGLHFGYNSAEYKFAEKYFSFISKDGRQAEKISYARYTPTATKPQLISTKDAAVLASFTAITAGSFKISLGGVDFTLENLDFSSATSMADVAIVLTTAINDNTEGGALFTAATVSFLNGAFILSGGDTGNISIGYAENVDGGNDVASLIGWTLADNPIKSDGCAAETITAALDRTTNVSNNYGSFTFMETMSTADITEAATWTNNQNVLVVFSQAVTSSTYAEVQAAVNGKDGVCLTLSSGSDNSQFMPMSIEACINYSRPAAATNFMFNQFDAETPLVDTDASADIYDAKKINYLGATQQAGKKIAFYQRGVLQGAISDIGVYVNEIWLKDAFLTEFLNLLVALKQLPANEAGEDIARGVMMPIIEEAKTNGVIQDGKNLTSVQKAYITSLTGDNEAWRQVQLNGWWLDLRVEDYQNALNGLTEYKINYLLVYGKGDSIRKVEGQDIMI